MSLNNMVSSRDVLARGLSERDLLRLPITSITRDSSGRITQIVWSGTHPEGHAFSITYTYIYASNGLISSEQRVYTGEGNTLTETETLTRDASGNVTSSAIVIS